MLLRNNKLKPRDITTLPASRTHVVNTHVVKHWTQAESTEA